MPIRRNVAVVLFALVVASPLLAKEKTRVFNGTTDQVFDAALRAAQKNWRVTFSDRQTWNFTFSTGTSLATWGMEVGGTLKEIEPGKIAVSVSSQKKAQVFAWGAGDRIATKFFDELERQLNESHSATGALPSLTKEQEQPSHHAPTERETSIPVADTSRAAAQTKPEYSSVIMRSTPEGAEITVDGKYVGSTASTVLMAPGEHAISIEKTGFKPWRRTLTVSPGGSVTVEAALEKP